MMLRNSVGMGLLLLVGTLPAAAQSPLEWKFEQGKKFKIEVVTETKQTVTVDNKATTRNSTLTTVSEFVVEKADAGSYTLKQTIESVQVKPSKPEEPTTPAASRYANLLKGTVFTFTINSAGKITGSLGGYDYLVKRLSGNNEEAEKSLRSLIPEEGFKESLGDIFGFLPDKAVSEDQPWTRKEVLSLPWGKLTGEARYTYKGKKDGAQQIDESHTWTYGLPEGGISGVTVTKGEIQVPVSKGTISVDPAAGKLISHKQTTQITGKLTISSVDTTKKDATAKDTKETVFTVDQTTTRTIRQLEPK